MKAQALYCVSFLLLPQKFAKIMINGLQCAKLQYSIVHQLKLGLYFVYYNLAKWKLYLESSERGLKSR
jgi:hypothetical protein